MELNEKLMAFIGKTKNIIGDIFTEEATKTSLVLPLFSILGYDIFNPKEFTPEYTADIGVKKGERVDYAIILNQKPQILIEVKSITEDIEKHGSQLFRYFTATGAKIGILTNGIKYNFYSDLSESNKMDAKPFFQFDLLQLDDSTINTLKNFCKDKFVLSEIIKLAYSLQYTTSIAKILDMEFSDPSDDFVRFLLSKGLYNGVKTQHIINKYKPTVKKALASYINSLVNQKLQEALNRTTSESESEHPDEIDTEKKIITTEEELESYHIVKAILAEAESPEKIFYKDTLPYFGILYDNKVTRWICRVYFRENSKYLIIPDKSRKEIKYNINTLSDIYNLRAELINRLKDVKREGKNIKKNENEQDNKKANNS